MNEIEQQRAAFEAWAKWFATPVRYIEAESQYANMTTEIAYQAWQAAIEHDRQDRQNEAEEVCGEAYQVVGSLLSDLGLFETDCAEKILDNLSQARMVHKDVLPWPSFDRQRRIEGEGK